MSFTSNSKLKTDPFIILRDQEHAADLFAVEQFRLAPKQKFLFHVAFGINIAACLDTSLVQTYGQEINMLVKAIDLPQYRVQTEELNQYNRKKVVQYRQKTEEINIKFHDDNMGLINKVWQNYYSYYNADPRSSTTPGAYSRNAMQNFNQIPTNYGLDNGSTAPFFNYIKIYQMARHEYVCYHLYNPIITYWNHNKLDYAQGQQTHDFDMKLNYEAVSYSVGVVNSENVEGFASTHYDNVPSPLRGTNPDPTVFDPSFVPAFDIEGLLPSLINNVVEQVSLAQTFVQASKQAIGPGFALGALSGPVEVKSGLPGVAFPGAIGNTTSTTATLLNLK